MVSLFSKLFTILQENKIPKEEKKSDHVARAMLGYNESKQ